MMAATHRDLPAGSQKWADEMDALRDEVATLKALCARMAQDLRIDPRDPQKNINVQSDSPAATSPVQQKLSGLADTDTMNVADKQVLTWNQRQQAWQAKDLPVSQGADFVPDKNDYIYDFSGTYYGWSPLAHGAAPDASGRYAFIAYDEGGEMMLSAHAGTSYSNLYLGTAGTSQSAASAGSSKDRLAYLESYSNDSGDNYYTSVQLIGGNVELYGDVLVGVSKAPKGFILPLTSTANRPTAAVMNEAIALGAITGTLGAVMYDTDLKKPIFWNGTEFTDANGTAV
jgi:hypothetical protein